MKNLKMSKMLMTATLVMVFILSGTKSKAQCAVSCDYIVQNLLNCDVTVSWAAWQPAGNQCAGNTGPITILAGQTLTITCADFSGCSFPICDLEITVLSWNGNALGVMAKSSNPNPSFGSPDAACSAGVPHMAWNTSATIIHQ